MALPAETTNVIPMVRHFEVADLSSHAAWVMPRLLKAYPHLSERSAAAFLQNVVWNNEFLFLHLPSAVGLAQVVSANSLSAMPVVYERFVWAQDPKDADSIAYAAEFYVEIRRWAKSLGAEAIIVEENTDVPHELVKQKLGRIFTRQQQFARL